MTRQDQQPAETHRLTGSNLVPLNSPVADGLSEVLKYGAQQLLAKAIEAEIAELLSQYSDPKRKGVSVYRCLTSSHPETGSCHFLDGAAAKM